MPFPAQGPLTILGLSFYMAFVTLWCRYVQLKTAGEDAGQDPLSIIILCSYGVLIQTFFHASMDDPGYLPHGWMPEKHSMQKLLEYCETCNGYKAPRSHHCRRCGHCIKRMDHHCMWIDNCVGVNNYGHFVLFLSCHLFSTLASLYTQCRFLVVGLNRPAMFHYSFTENVPGSLYFTMFIILSSAVVVSILLLLISLLMAVQIRNICSNLTIVERNIVTEAIRSRPHVPIVNPYDLGLFENIWQIMHLNQYDGVNWPVANGTHKYALIVEQLRQKYERAGNKHGKKVKVVKSYAGSMLPLSHGVSTVMDSPLSFESRLEVAPGDNLIVSRRTANWAYGHKEGNSRAGWVPADCVEEDNPPPGPMQMYQANAPNYYYAGQYYEQ